MLEVTSDTHESGKDPSEIFRQYFPQGTLRSIAPEDVEGFAREWLARIVKENCDKPNSSVSYFTVEAGKDARTFVVKYEEQGADFRWNAAYLLDVLEKSPTGEGSFGFNPYSTSAPYPSELRNKTFEHHVKRGFGTKRLEVMNALTRAWYGKPLSSSPESNLVGHAKDVWTSLTKLGKARYIAEERRFEFL